jgi:4-hydroxy-tetrahydrodipicolinate synthase
MVLERRPPRPHLPLLGVVEGDHNVTEITGGAWAASLTPLNDDLSVDPGACVAHVRWLLDSGCAGVAALGTTGEANSFSLAERLDLIATLGRAGVPAVRMMVGVGCCAAPDTVALARAALDAGFANVLMLPPFYYKNVSQDGIFNAYARVIEEVNDFRLRVFVYDFPQQTGLTLGLELLERLSRAFAGVVVGVKNSSGDWGAMEAAATRLSGFKVFAGTEQFLLAALRAGGPGCISATANVTGRQLAEVVAHWKTGAADALQEEATRRRRMLERYPAIPALKEIMAHASGRPQWRRLRPPLVNLAAADAERLIGEVREAGVLEGLGIRD